MPPINVEVKGRTADRFRAYGASELQRPPNASDHRKRALAGEPAFKKGEKVSYPGEDVVAEGSVSGNSVTIAAGKENVTRVVLFRGPVESEVVVGSVDVNQSGNIEINIVETPAEDE